MAPLLPQCITHLTLQKRKSRGFLPFAPAFPHFFYQLLLLPQRLKTFRLHHSLTSTISPTVHTQASKHGGWKVSITYLRRASMNTMGLRDISGTRDSPRVRRASRRRRSTPSPERTGTQSRLVISNFDAQRFTMANPTSSRPLTLSTFESELRLRIRLTILVNLVGHGD